MYGTSYTLEAFFSCVSPPCYAYDGTETVVGRREVNNERSCIYEERRTVMHFPWRYWMDVRSLVVLLLFLAHSCIVYECAIEGFMKIYGQGFTNTLNGYANADNQPLLIGPIYSFRVHFYEQQRANENIEGKHDVTRVLAPANCLILMFSGHDAGCDQLDVVKRFSRSKLWSLVVPLNPFHDFPTNASYRLPMRHLHMGGEADTPVPVLIHLRDISTFLDVEKPMLPHRITLSGTAITACFLVGTDPAFVQVSTRGTLQDELLAEPGSSRISSMALYLSRLHGASLLVFISPCRTDNVYTWNSKAAEFSTEAAAMWWWVCVASDTLLELNTVAKLLTVVAGE